MGHSDIKIGDTEYVTLSTIMRRIGTRNRQTIYRHIKLGKLPHPTRLLGRLRLWDRSIMAKLPAATN